MTISLRKVLLVWLWLAYSAVPLHHSGWAAERNLLLYASSTEFLPAIENVLRGLRHRETGLPIFSRVTNLNKWFINRQELGNLDNLVRFYESAQQLKTPSKDALKGDSLVGAFVREGNTYIRIDVLPKPPLLEYQLVITDSLPPVKQNGYPVIISTESRYEGFVVDISRDDYRYQLENALKGLFPESNRPPTAVVKVSAEKQEDGYHYVGTGHTVVLDAAESYDPDTPPERLTFRWRQQSAGGELAPLTEREITALDPSSRKQTLAFQDTGEYHFALTVSDGITESDQKMIKIRAVEPPRLSSQRLHSMKSKGVLSDRKFHVPFSVELEQGDSAEVKVLRASLTWRRSPWTRWIRGEPQSRPLDPAKQQVRRLFTTGEGQRRISHYELVVEHKMTQDDWRYQFQVAAEDPRGTGDTLDVRVDFRSNDYCFAVDFVKFAFFGKKDTLPVDQRVLALRFGTKIHLYKGSYFEFGSIETLWEEDIEDSLDIFAIPHMYVELGSRALSVPIYFSSGRTGFGGRFRLGPISLGVTRFGHKYLSIDVSVGSDLSIGTGGLLMIGSMIVRWASL